jgi:hypothetical protein
MKLTTSVKFWLVFSCIIVAAFLGGILGNWVFIYLLNKYYSTPSGNYLTTQNSSSVVVRDNKKTVAQEDNRLAQTITNANQSLVRIFKKQGTDIYQPKDAVIVALAMTSDGWLVAVDRLPNIKNNNWQDYEAITADRKRFAIDKAITEPTSQLAFIHLAKAQNLKVNGFVASKDLTISQTLIALGLDDSIAIGRLSQDNSVWHSSDTTLNKLFLSEITNKQAYIFDVNNQMVGLIRNGNVLAMDSVENILEKLLTEKEVVYPRLGVTYLDLTKVLGQQSDTGALIAAPDKVTLAILPGSPAEKSGLKIGDIITAVDDTPINEFNSLNSLIQEYNPQDTIVLTILRAGKNEKISVQLDEVINK